MPQMHGRDKPTFYRIVDADGNLLATAPKSKAMQLKAKLEKETGKTLRLELIEDGSS